MGEWASGHPNGIRKYKYSVNSTTNPFTYKDCDKVGSDRLGVGRGTLLMPQARCGKFTRWALCGLNSSSRSSSP